MRNPFTEVCLLMIGAETATSARLNLTGLAATSVAQTTRSPISTNLRRRNSRKLVSGEVAGAVCPSVTDTVLCLPARRRRGEVERRHASRARQRETNIQRLCASYYQVLHDVEGRDSEMCVAARRPRVVVGLLSGSWLNVISVCAVLFDSFDLDASGVIDEDEFVNLCATGAAAGAAAAGVPVRPVSVLTAVSNSEQHESHIPGQLHEGDARV